MSKYRGKMCDIHIVQVSGAAKLSDAPVSLTILRIRHALDAACVTDEITLAINDRDVMRLATEVGGELAARRGA